MNGFKRLISILPPSDEIVKITQRGSKVFLLIDSPNPSTDVSTGCPFKTTENCSGAFTSKLTMGKRHGKLRQHLRVKHGLVLSELTLYVCENCRKEVPSCHGKSFRDVHP